MDKLTNVERIELEKEFARLGVRIKQYHAEMRCCLIRNDTDKANYYLNEAGECLRRREEILVTLYGQGTGVAI